MEKVYKFNVNDFNEDGISKTNNKFFLDLIKDWEEDFYKTFHPIKATHFFSNSRTMLLIDNCLNLEDERSGMELINGKIDIETNFKIEEYSHNRTIYAIGSALENNKEEPLFLVIDDKLTDGIVQLKYIPDNGCDGDETSLPTPVDEKIKV